VAYVGGSVRAIARRSERRKILCVCVGGREEQRDLDEGRSGDWLKIGEISKKRSSKKFYIDVWCSSVSMGEIFFICPSGDPHPAPPPGVTTLNETLEMSLAV
jgi:hypothetical protein